MKNKIYLILSIISFVLALVLILVWAIAANARPQQVIYPTNLTTGDQYRYMWYDGGVGYGGLLVIGCTGGNPEVAIMLNLWDGDGYQFWELITLMPGITAPETTYYPKLKDLSIACKLEISSPTKNPLKRFYLPIEIEPAHLRGMDAGVDAYPPPTPYP